MAVDLDHGIGKKTSLVGLLGYSFFPSEAVPGKDLAYVSLILNLRRYIWGTARRWFVEAGPGLYVGTPGPDDFGLHLGTGLDVRLAPEISLEVGLSADWVDLNLPSA